MTEGVACSITLTLFVKLMCLMPLSFRKGTILSCSSNFLLKKSSNRHCTQQQILADLQEQNSLALLPRDASLGFTHIYC